MTDAPSEILIDTAVPAIVKDERSGREYVSPYRYERQFELEFEEATRVLRHKYGRPTERYSWAIIPVLWIFLSLCGQAIAHGVPLLALAAGSAIALQTVLFLLLLGGVVVVSRWAFGGAARFQKRLIEERLCFECGYALIGQQVDEAGRGRCPECGKTFDVRRYLRPPKRYHRVAKK